CCRAARSRTRSCSRSARSATSRCASTARSSAATPASPAPTSSLRPTGSCWGITARSASSDGSMRALIFGGRGMLGRAVAEEAGRRGWPALALGHAEADVTDAAAVSACVREHAPQVVFNCAAFTAVDACEERREHAFAVNGDAVGTIAAAAREAGAALVHVSSDYVFDGAASEPYPEDHATAPLSVYGASKLRGEERALEYDGSLVVRASWLFGPGGPNFVLTMLRLIDQGKVPLRVV